MLEKYLRDAPLDLGGRAGSLGLDKFFFLCLLEASFFFLLASWSKFFLLLLLLEARFFFFFFFFFCFLKQVFFFFASWTKVFALGNRYWYTIHFITPYSMPQILTHFFSHLVVYVVAMATPNTQNQKTHWYFHEFKKYSCLPIYSSGGFLITLSRGGVAKAAFWYPYHACTTFGCKVNAKKLKIHAQILPNFSY